MHKVFFLVIAFAAVFVWWSSAAMPPVVASHFAAGGAADDFMPRGGYVALMLAMVVGVPSLVYFIGSFASRLPAPLIYLPNRQYWLAPERRTATLASLASFSVVAAYATLGLLCLVHWFVVQANLEHPARLAQVPLAGIMALFFLALGAGMIAVLRRFFRAPSSRPRP